MTKRHEGVLSPFWRFEGVERGTDMYQLVWTFGDMTKRRSNLVEEGGFYIVPRAKDEVRTNAECPKRRDMGWM
jgi:hypothetical protein